ncbi:MAG: aspartate--tRNA ligase [Firmicutes bacterium]|nr:aspartate--tRNA ligase [Bacillota bacterium]
MAESMGALKRSIMCGDIRADKIGESLTVMGWVQRRRDLGKLIFIALRDRTGIIQVTVDGNTAPAELFAKAESLRSEFVLAVRGTLRSRGEKDKNPNMKTGEVELLAEEIKILAESETPPFQIEDGLGIRDDLRLKYRYLDLRRPELYRNIRLRHEVVQIVRNYMDQNGFLEIETPILTKSTPEGARDYLVPSRVHPGSFYALPQSPQLFKQILMVSGMDKYYQIARCFRDEDLRADRQPEFTQIDMELSFVDVDDVIAVNEGLIKTVFESATGQTVNIPFPRMTYAEAMERYGSDKPDTRFGIELKNISELVKDSEFGVFKNALAAGGSVRAINAKGCGGFPRKQIDALGEFAKTYGAKGLAWIALASDGKIKSPIQKFFSEEGFDEIINALEGEPGDLLLFCADNDKVVFDTLGALRIEIANRLELLDPNEFKFTWVTEFPLLEYDDEEQRFVAVHHPFTSPMDEDIELLDTDPGKARAKAYDLALNGTELGGGSIRIHRADVQEKMFSLLGFSEEDAYERFGYLLNAFKYGVPPHGGLAFGLDRMIMLITGASSIRDVIAFPKVKDASCPMTDAPGVVDDKQLEELFLDVKELPEKEPKETE